MNLEGQAARVPPHLASGPAARERGYAMAALLTMLAVMAILMSAALPVWRHQMRREKEAELVFRGEQYARAIGLFNRKFQTYPPDVDVLVKQKFLRKKYKDPITGKDFRPIYAGGIAAQGQPVPGQPAGQPSITPGTPGSPGAPGQPSRFGSPSEPRGGPGSGLMGVVSQSDEDSIRIYKGRTKYSQWQFIFAQAQGRPGGPAGRPRPGGPGGRGAPGMPRRPGGPGGSVDDQSPLSSPRGLRPSSPNPPPMPRPPGGAR